MRSASFATLLFALTLSTCLGQTSSPSASASDRSSLSASPSGSHAQNDTTAFIDAGSAAANFTNATNATAVTCRTSALLANAFHYAFSDAVGLPASAAACSAQIELLSRQQFGPPSTWEIMLSVCKGTCRRYSSQLQQLNAVLAATGCSCPPYSVQTFGASTFACYPAAEDLLCRFTGVCASSHAYLQMTLCNVSACGRLAGDEASYRSARGSCGFSGVRASSLSAAAIALVVFTMAHVVVI